MITDLAALLLFGIAVAAIGLAAQVQEPPLLTPEPSWIARRRSRDEASGHEADRFIAALRPPEPARHVGKHRIQGKTSHRRGTGQTSTVHYNGGAGAKAVTGGAGGTGSTIAQHPSVPIMFRVVKVPQPPDGTVLPWAMTTGRTGPARHTAAEEGPGESSITFRVRDVLRYDLDRYLKDQPAYRDGED